MRKVVLGVLLLVVGALAYMTYLPPLGSLAKALVSTDDDTRNMALARISKLDAEKKLQLVDDLLKETNSADWQRRRFALYALRKTNAPDEKTFPVVLALLEDPESQVRQEAMIGLSEMDTKNAPALLEMLPKKSGHAREGITRALIGMGQEALPAFRAALTNSDPVIRAETAVIVGQVSPKLAAITPDLVSLLKDKEAVVRRKSALALSVIAPQLKDTLPAHLENIRRKVWDDDAPGAVKALGALGPNAKAAVPDLNVLLKSSTDSLINRNAPRPLLAETLNAIDPRKNGLVGLLWDLKGKDAVLRYRAAYTLSETKPDSGVLPDLLRAMDDKDVYVRARATVATARIGFDKSVRLQTELTKKAAESLTIVKEEQVEGFGNFMRTALKIEAPVQTEDDAHTETPAAATAP